LALDHPLFKNNWKWTDACPIVRGVFDQIFFHTQKKIRLRCLQTPAFDFFEGFSHSFFLQFRFGFDIGSGFAFMTGTSKFLKIVLF